MNNLKGKVSLLLVAMMMITSILPIFTAFAETCEVTMTVKMGNTTMKAGNTYYVTGGEKISVNASSDAGIAFIGYRYVKNGSKGEITDVDDDSLTITVPNGNPGTEIALRIEAVANNDDGSANTVTKTGWREYILRYESKVEPIIGKDIEVSFGNKVLKENSTTEVAVGQNLDIKVLPSNKVNVGIYAWDDEDAYEFKGATKSIVVPDRFKQGTTHTLYVTAEYEDGDIPNWEKYIISIPVAQEIDDELIVESWMKENKDLDGLAVSLRVDSDNDDKVNRNIYALNEEVTYYIDYANCTSKDIPNAKIVFETELDCKVVDSFGGVVDGKKVTWEFPEGIEKDQKGTKVLVVEYTSLGKNSVKSKIIHPVADIYNSKKVVDSSAVVNLIFRDEDTEITNDEHYPYMFGDANATTFRPDDAINRAEGALVLTRIFGINTSGTTITNVFSDLNETYPEAQRAIVAASQIGLINGYEDGTYKPNQAMTKAEFMKIIAKYVELTAEDDDIRGMEIKDIEDEIKIYKNPTKSYVIGNSTVNEHWALSYVTFLTRLNMTPVSSKNKDLKLDQPITRAEVAQLVNLYLLRAPAETSSKTKSGFSDVNKNHKLFGDIIEATREAHTYYLTENGTEVVD